MIEIRARRGDYDTGLMLAVFERNRDGERTHFAQNATMVPVDAGAIGHELFATSDPDGTVARRLMDDLWNAGIRPTEHGSAGHLAAIQDHLRDATVQREAFYAQTVAQQALLAEVVRNLIIEP